MSQSISNFIFKHPIFTQSKSFSTASEIDDFFASVPEDVIQKWPFDLTKSGLETKYLSAKIYPETWKDDAFCLIQAEIFNGRHKAIVEQSFRFGWNNQLIIDIDSIRKEGSDAYPQNMKIAHRLSENNFRFIQAYDKSRKVSESSCIRIHASSEFTKQNIQTCGGYVWANNGFDFLNRKELEQTRSSFKSFAKKYNIPISDKNLRLFTKPCHFAAYSCGLMINYHGKLYHAGKAFLLQHSWFGIQKASSINSVERKYSHAYYTEPLPALRRKRALLQLSKNYRSFLRNTYKRTFLSRISHKFKTMRRFISYKFANFYRC